MFWITTLKYHCSTYLKADNIEAWLGFRVGIKVLEKTDVSQREQL
jgi:hypothetical protein